MFSLPAAVLVEEEDIQDILNKFTDILCLHHWMIKYRIEDDEKMRQSLMKVVPTRSRSLATISIRRSLVGRSMAEFGPLLLHELLHLVLEPIVEEHASQLQYEVSPERLKEYQERFRRPLEKVVEHLTKQFIPLITFVTVASRDPATLESLKADNQRLIAISEQTNVFLELIFESLQPYGAHMEKVGVLAATKDTLETETKKEVENGAHRKE